MRVACCRRFRLAVPESMRVDDLRWLIEAQWHERGWLRLQSLRHASSLDLHHGSEKRTNASCRQSATVGKATVPFFGASAWRECNTRVCVNQFHPVPATFDYIGAAR